MLVGYSILDCILLLDFRHSPPTTETQLAKEFLDIDKMCDELNKRHQHTKGTIERNRRDRAFTAGCVQQSSDGDMGLLPKTFP